MERRLRLRKSKDFQRIRRDGCVIRHPFVMVSYAPNHFDYNRYGFITSKHLGNAVVRNRVRRLLRESIRQLDPQIVNGYDMVFIGRNQIVEQPFYVIVRILNELFNRAGLLGTLSTEDGITS